MSSHDALRLKVIYQNVRDVIILFGHSIKQHANMASFGVRSKSGKALQNPRLLYVSCVSKEDFPVRPVGLSRVELICRLLRFVVSIDVVCSDWATFI